MARLSCALYPSIFHSKYLFIILSSMSLSNLKSTARVLDVQNNSLLTRYDLSHSCRVMLVLILAPCDECVVAQCEYMNIWSTCSSSKLNTSSSFTMLYNVISLPLIPIILNRKFTLILGSPTHFLAINVSPISYLFFFPCLFLISFATFLHLMIVYAEYKTNCIDQI